MTTECWSVRAHVLLPFYSQKWSMSNFPAVSPETLHPHSMKDQAFQSLLRWKMIILPILTTSVYIALPMVGRMYVLTSRMAGTSLLTKVVPIRKKWRQKPRWVEFISDESPYICKIVYEGWWDSENCQYNNNLSKQWEATFFILLRGGGGGGGGARGIWNWPLLGVKCLSCLDVCLNTSVMANFLCNICNGNTAFLRSSSQHSYGFLAGRKTGQTAACGRAPISVAGHSRVIKYKFPLEASPEM